MTEDITRDSELTIAIDEMRGEIENRLVGIEDKLEYLRCVTFLLAERTCGLNNVRDHIALNRRTLKKRRSEER